MPAAQGLLKHTMRSRAIAKIIWKPLPACRRASAIPALGLVLIGIVVLAPLLRAGFFWDDDLYIYGNPLIKSPDGLRCFWFSRLPVDYYPLSNSLLWLQWRLWDGNPAGYHLVNLLLHLGSALVFYHLACRLGLRGAWLAAALFVVHPTAVSAVGWPAQAKTLLAVFLAAVALVFWVRAFDSQISDQRWAAASVACYIAALLAKTSVVGLPLVMALLLWWKAQGRRLRLWWYVWVGMAAGLALGLVTVWFQYHRAMPAEVQSLRPLGERFTSVLHAFWFYLLKAYLPVDVSFIYPPWPDGDSARVLVEIGGVVGLGAVAVLLRKSIGRALLVILGSFVALMFPVLGLFDIGYLLFAPVADHWLYTGIFALILPEAWAISVFASHPARTGRIVGRIVAMVVLLVYCLAANRRAQLFTDAEAVWQDAARRYPRAWFAHLSLGNAMLERGDAESALRYYERVRELKPDWPALHVNYGIALAQVERHAEAERAFRQALELWPDHAFAHYNLALLLRKQGRQAEAREHLEKVLEILPDDINALQNLADLLATASESNVRDPSRAIVLAKRACDLTEWKVPGLLVTLAECYIRAGKPEQARRLLAQAERQAWAARDKDLREQINRLAAQLGSN